jgi:hypothetical protein
VLVAVARAFTRTLSAQATAWAHSCTSLPLHQSRGPRHILSSSPLAAAALGPAL